MKLRKNQETGRIYANDLASSKYSKLSKIDKKNVKQLAVAWRWNSPDNEILKSNQNLFTFFNEATPIAIDGYLYVSTALGQVAKIKGSSGQTE